MGQKMYNVTIQGITKQYPEKIPYSEIVKEYEGSTDAPVMLVIVNGEEGTSMGFMLAGIAFAAIGAGLLFFGIKNMLSEEKIKKAKAAKNAAMEAAAGGELKKEDASGQNRSMSIAERANMVKNLEDEEEDGENEKE